MKISKLPHRLPFLTKQQRQILEFILKRLPGAMHTKIYGPANRDDLGRSRLYLFTGDVGSFAVGRQLDTIQEKRLKEALAVFSWRTINVLHGLGETKIDAQAIVQDYIGLDAFESVSTTGYKYAPHWTNFETQKDASDSDETDRIITSIIFPSSNDEKTIRSFHLEAINALLHALDQAKSQGDYQRVWNQEFYTKDEFPKLKNPKIQRERKPPDNWFDCLWISILSNCNPAHLWPTLNWDEQQVNSLTVAGIVGQLIYGRPVKMSPELSYSIIQLYESHPSDILSDAELDFCLNSVKTLLERVTDLEIFFRRKNFQKHFKIYPRNYKRKKLIYRLKDAVWHLHNQAPPSKQSR